MSESWSSRPSPFGVSAAAESATRPRSRVIVTGTSIVASRPPVPRASTCTTYAPSGNPAPSKTTVARPGTAPGPRLELGHRRAVRVEEADRDVRVGGEREPDRGRVGLPVAVRRDRGRRGGRAGELEGRRRRRRGCGERSLRRRRSARLDPPPRARGDRALRQPRPVDPRAGSLAATELDAGGVHDDGRPREGGRELRREARAAGLVRASRPAHRSSAARAPRRASRAPGAGRTAAPRGRSCRLESRWPEIARRKTGMPGPKRSLPDEIPLKVESGST